MQVFSINLCQEEEYLEERKVFQKVVMNQLQVYGINLMEVTPTNVALNKRKLDEKPLVIVYNSGKIQNELDENIEQFLEKAKEKQADIWPVAFSKEAREPVDNISKKQSYDIWEQLRCRGLDKIHISAIAKAFSRKIIARELPTLYNNCGEVFISHRRIDGEEIAALIYDKIKIQEEKLKIFRDVAKVNVGDEAQTEIDEVMKNSEIFIFIHTGKAAESDWILKELRFALLRNIPILWVQIDGADVKKLRIKPSDQPHLSYSSEDFEKEETLTEIIDEILQKAFELIMLNSNKIFDYKKDMWGRYDDWIQNREGYNKMKTKLVLLGTGTPNACPNANGPSSAVVVGDRAYIVDFGPGVVRQASAAYFNGIDALRPDLLTVAFCTHLHTDHTAGYPDLIFTPWVLERPVPLKVFGPKGMQHMTNHILKAYETDIDFRINGFEKANESGYRVEVTEIESGIIYKDDRVTVEAFPVSHGTLECYGYKFITPDKTIVITGDTAPLDIVAEKAKDCDILLHEVEYAAGISCREPKWQKYHREVHTLSTDLAQVAKKANPKLLVTYHRIYHMNIQDNRKNLAAEMAWRDEAILDEIREAGYEGYVVNGKDLDVF